MTTALANRPIQDSIIASVDAGCETNGVRATELMRTEIDFIPNREFEAESEFCDDVVVT